MSDMKKAYQLAAFAVRRRFFEQHPDDLARLDRLKAEEVAVFQGSYDSVEKVLRLLGVPFRIYAKAKKQAPKIVFLNCSGGYSPTLTKPLAGWVKDGTWLVSSDWALPQLERMFPGTVRRTAGSSWDEVISVEPYLDSLWSEVAVLGADPQWWLESGSYPIEVMDPQKVKIEAASHELLVRYGAPAVAVRFAWGKGQVFHVMSHFWHKRSRTPTSRHQGPGVDFLRVGMRLSDEGIEEVLRQAKVKPEEVNFATLQSCATATELIAQLCARAQTQ